MNQLSQRRNNMADDNKTTTLGKKKKDQIEIILSKEGEDRNMSR